MLALIKRNCILYFRNRSGVIFSLMGALISFILYLVFLKDNIESSWSRIDDTNQLLDTWLMGGTLAITGITTTLSSLSQWTKDKESHVRQDLLITDLGYWPLSFSYILSAAFIGFVMQLIMLAIMGSYFYMADQVSLSWSVWPQLLAVMLLNTLISTLLNALLVSRMGSVDNLGKLATVFGAASGFLVGTYVPIGALPDFAQTLMKCTPGAYIASLFRQVLMADTLKNNFSQSSAREHFEKLMGIRLDWQDLLTNVQTYYIVVGILAIGLVLFSLQNALMQRRVLV
ncbi:ABC transporter permease [Streptococcus ratti]|uniref:ABC transporter, integral membrane protein n=1 Tax=Streptococcus ratti FA-1 = DSM 20564 TaxID=699248 RepID=A0ABP2R1L8_STRRT|nr:ABC transporter permease [Streptococcus ratti]EJN95133.1 putative ABC transporter, integral membrane protein [Streptococcus ratti FA-1 = DSM 20564]EMP71606.1 putative ABC transporter integral membrane protein [Streptococcus ratti FA-1 = DSM 20564]QEY07128.1 ABC transporter permease [Streptococcus ratti]VEI59553.1 ABC transporter integral membrane protein [Streptococcus mutans]